MLNHAVSIQTTIRSGKCGYDLGNLRNIFRSNFGLSHSPSRDNNAIWNSCTDIIYFLALIQETRWILLIIV